MKKGRPMACPSCIFEDDNETRFAIDSSLHNMLRDIG